MFKQTFFTLVLILCNPLVFAQSIDQNAPEDIEVEVHAGHIHGQANIQIITTKNSLVFEIDFPADDMKDHSPKNILSIRNPDQLYTLKPANPTCALIKSSFEKKELQGGHADFIISFEYACKDELDIDSIDLNPFFELPIHIEHAKTHLIFNDQVLAPVDLKKKNAFIKLKKK